MVHFHDKVPRIKGGRSVYHMFSMKFVEVLFLFHSVVEMFVLLYVTLFLLIVRLLHSCNIVPLMWYCSIHVD